MSVTYLCVTNIVY